MFGEDNFGAGEDFKWGLFEDFKVGFVGLFETIKLVFGERRNDRFRRRAGACSRRLQRIYDQ